ncbi:MAG: IPT/TIG domain-containing protein, partial [Prevotella sp.]|nr:IPT/TIG domain-containing protein [Prevotella sp.]
MKHIINYLSALIAVVLIGATFTACTEDDDNGSANVGLGIKTFFPTKVVANQPMTINGSGFNNVKEIEFPGGSKVTNFEVVSDNMLRLDAPAGIAADGGKIVVRTANDEAESRLPLTLGHTNVTGFSKQPGEEVNGGDQITIFGTDLEFINAIELLDADSVPQLIDHKDFYRKGTDNLIFNVPPKNIYEGTWVGKIHTYDGQEFLLPELAYVPASDGGHWETVKTVIWENPDPAGNGETGWSGTYRFAPESNSTGEEIYTIPQDIWEKMKSGTFYMTFQGSDWIDMKITTGWW